MDAVYAENLLAWLAQVTLIASAGALLGAIVKLRHARARLVYCYGVIVAAIVLPAFQPVQDSLLFTRDSARPQMAAAAPSAELAWPAIVLLVLAAGVFVRLAWYVAGFVQLRRLRRQSAALATLPDSLCYARRAVGVDAAFRMSDAIGSPAALGHVDSVILLPRSFPALPARAQYAIAVHELLHVRRGDWLRTVIEQWLTVVFWFNPGMWWLVAESRLCREEIVDAEVVELTGARAPYVDALLRFAAVKSVFRPLPAAQFFSKRQFAQRMNALVRPQHWGLGSLAFACSVMIGLVLACALSSFVLFPMQGRTELHALEANLLSPPMFFKPITSAEVRVRAERIAVPSALPTWTAALPAPAEGSPRQNVVFLFRTVHADPPGISHEGLFVSRAVAGIRAIRPGQVVPTVEIERLLTTVPEGHRVMITQDEDNRVMRVVMDRVPIRRVSDEVDVVTFDVPLDAVNGATTPAGPADGID